MDVGGLIEEGVEVGLEGRPGVGSRGCGQLVQGGSGILFLQLQALLGELLQLLHFLKQGVDDLDDGVLFGEGRKGN